MFVFVVFFLFVLCCPLFLVVFYVAVFAALSFTTFFISARSSRETLLRSADAAHLKPFDVGCWSDQQQQRQEETAVVVFDDRRTNNRHRTASTENHNYRLRFLLVVVYWWCFTLRCLLVAARRRGHTPPVVSGVPFLSLPSHRKGRTTNMKYPSVRLSMFGSCSNDERSNSEHNRPGGFFLLIVLGNAGPRPHTTRSPDEIHPQVERQNNKKLGMQNKRSDRHAGRREGGRFFVLRALFLVVLDLAH